MQQQKSWCLWDVQLSANIIPVWHLAGKHWLGTQSRDSCCPAGSLPCPARPALTLTMVETKSNTSTAMWRNRIPNKSRSMVAGSWARDLWSGACGERKTGVRRLPWPGGPAGREGAAAAIHIPAQCPPAIEHLLPLEQNKQVVRTSRSPREARGGEEFPERGAEATASLRPTWAPFRARGTWEATEATSLPESQGGFPRRREAQRAAPGSRPKAWGRPPPEAGFPDPSAPRVPLLASKFPPVFASGERPPRPRLGLDAGGWGAGEQAGWKTARLPSFPRAGFRTFPAPRGVKSLQPRQLHRRPLDGPTDS